MTDTIESLKAQLAEVEAENARWCARIAELDARRLRAEEALAGRDLVLRVKRLWSTSTVPKYHSAGAGGLDLHVDIGAYDDLCADAGPAVHRVRTGIAVEIPPGYVGLIRPRSSAVIRGIRVLPGTIDSDYRGEIVIQVQGPFRLENGDRIAQLVIVPAPQMRILAVHELSETARGAAGFGSTGSK